MNLEVLTKEDYLEFMKNGLIAPYEETLIENLRQKEAYGLPLSLFLLSKPCCVKNCYPMSVFLSMGMTHFEIVHGNINCILKSPNVSNHSWVENNGYVYDTTDGFKWDKDLYYMLFEPEILEKFNQEQAMKDPYYQEVLKQGRIPVEKSAKGLMVQYLECLENEKNTVNHQRLLNEISYFREKEALPIYSNEILMEYQKQMKKKKTK